MTIDEVIELLNASRLKALSPLQEMVLHSAWEGKTYTDMAKDSNYVKEYLSRTAAELWVLLSDFWKEPIQKTNFRKVLESRELSPAHLQLIEEWRLQQMPTTLEFPSGPVALNSAFYIERPPVEFLAYEEVTKPGSLIRIKGSQKMGKSSLMLRILAHAHQKNYPTVLIDFQQADSVFFSNTDRFFRWFCANVSRELQLPSKIDEYWDEEIGSKVSCTLYFQRYLLEQMSWPVVVALNEVNRLFEYPEIARDFFPLLRFWYEQARQNKIWQKLHLMVVYSTETCTELNLNQSPLNVGLPLKLPPFTPAQVLSLAKRHGLNLTETQIQQLMAMLGGHPYLLRLAFYYLSGFEKMTLSELLAKAPTESGIYNNYLRRLYGLLQAKPGLMAAYQKVIEASVPVQLESSLAYRLDSMGLVTVEGNCVSPQCELFRHFFKNQWLQFE